VNPHVDPADKSFDSLCCHPLLSFALRRLVKGVLIFFCPLY
jgi:hypothetical protein